jgi:3',5'-cyclic AMP phosphodiesterase CpdA
MVAPGNHDTPYLGPLEIVERLVAPWKRYEQRFGPADDIAWQGQGASVFAINTARGAQIRWNWSKGAVSSGQTRRLCKRLRDSPAGDVRIVVCHHPLIEIVGGPMTARVRGGTYAAETLVEAGADLVLSGHIHTPFVAPYPFGDGKTVAVGSGTLVGARTRHAAQFQHHRDRRDRGARHGPGLRAHGVRGAAQLGVRTPRALSDARTARPSPRRLGYR